MSEAGGGLSAGRGESPAGVDGTSHDAPSPKAGVACLGILVADLVGRGIDLLPERGRLAFAERMDLAVGGCAANSAVALARLGVPVSVIGRVGRDALGDFLVERLRREGVAMRGIGRDSREATSATMVLVARDGERSFIHYRGANAGLGLEDVPWEALRASRFLHVAGANVMPALDGAPTDELLRRAKEMGLVTSLDTTWDATGRWSAIPDEAYARIDYLLPSLEEARAISGLEDPEEVGRWFLDRGVRVVALKMGGEGCLVMSRDGLLRRPAPQVDVRDTTGAGDAFAGGWLAGLARGWDLERVAHLAVAVGSHCVEAPGATTALPRLQEVIDRFGV